MVTFGNGGPEYQNIRQQRDCWNICSTTTSLTCTKLKEKQEEPLHGTTQTDSIIKYANSLTATGQNRYVNAESATKKLTHSITY